MRRGHVTYTATRSIAPGHQIGVVYELPLLFLADATQSVQDLKEEPEAMAGNFETLFYGQVRRWSFSVAAMSIPQAANLREFLDSTAGGELFTMDPYGSPEAPRQLMTVRRRDTGYTEERVLPYMRGGHDDLVVYRFRVQVV